MTETTQAAAEVNPFEPSAHATGGGLWDGKTVTITRALAKTEPLTYKDGKPVIDEKTGQQSIQTGLFITGIAEGGDDKERTEVYGVGDKLAPTADGEGFVAKDGGPAKFHANSGIAKFSTAAKAGGFDLSTLMVGGKMQLSRLVGARFVFKGEPKLDRAGKPLKDKKGYDKSTFLPVKFIGYVAGGSAVAKAGNGAAAPGADAIRAKASEKVLAALAAGPLTRADLVRTLAQSLAGDADANAIIGLVVRDDFHKGQPWKYDGTRAEL